MPYLSLENQPPSPAKTPHKADSRKEGPMGSTKQTSETTVTEENSTTYFSEQDVSMNTYPVVQLDVDTISDTVAGRLASSLLGHVLFLKNQVPFPVMQLGRLPCGKANSRAFRQRTELLASFDTISSHFNTTFSALSTALARCADTSSGQNSQAHIAILVGPSLGTAKSKVILAMNGIETRIWGIREDVPKLGSEVINDSDEESEEDEEQDDDEGHCSGGADDGESSAEEPEESDDEDDDDDESEAVNSEDDCDDEYESESGQTTSQPTPSYISYAEEQKFLQNVDRLLSRTLAAADAEGNGISSEMSPTLTHVLLHAPRRFCHPAWIPRQNVTAALDTALRDFMNNSGLSTIPLNSSGRNGHSSKKNKVEGVWITARSGIQRPSGAQYNSSTHAQESPIENDADEMIWWSWDGKIVGFNEW